MTILARSFVALALVSLAAPAARATQFVLQIDNTTGAAWSGGLVTLAPAIELGATPQSGGAGFPAYAYVEGACGGGDAVQLAADLALTLGQDAWLVPALGAGDHASIVVDVAAASPAPALSFIARIAGGNDAFVAMHLPGDPTVLSSRALFDSAGLPVAQPSFELGGYDANSVSDSDGSGASCPDACDAGVEGCYVSPGNAITGASLTAQPARGALDNPWIYAAPADKTTDGLALGDVSGNASRELVVLCEGWGWGTTIDQDRSGAGIVLSSLSSASPADSQWSAPEGHELVGFPTITEVGGVAQYLVQDFLDDSGTGANVYAVAAGASAPSWSHAGLAYPGSWNMGASAGDLDGLPGDEIVVPTFWGQVLVLAADSGATLASIDLSAVDGLSGHVAIADVTANPGNEIVAFGSITGTLYALAMNAEGGLDIAWQSSPAAGLMPIGGGPAVADLDGDGHAEIVVADGNSNRVFAYDPGYDTGCKYEWLLPSGDGNYALSSPTIGDVDGDGKPEIVVLSSAAVLSVLHIPAAPEGGCADGTVAWRYTVGLGEGAYFTPVLADLTGDGALDIVAASYTTLEILDAHQQQLAYRYSDPTASFYPSAVVEPRPMADGTPAASLYVSGWANGKVYRLTTPSDAPVPTEWTSFMGGNARTGAR